MTGLRYLEEVVTLQLDIDKCIGCGLCARNACIECGACARNCPVTALTVKAGVGCASAIIHSWLTGEEPNCDCGGSC